MHALLPVLRALRDADVSYVVVDGVAEWIRDRNLTVFSPHDPDDPRREVDLFAQEPMPFGELRERARALEARRAWEQTSG